MNNAPLANNWRISYQDDRPPDPLGRRHFALLWSIDGRNRAQHFFADPAPYLAKYNPTEIKEAR